MGTVFEAEDLENGRRVALKVLSQALDSPEARQRFFREGRLAASINHPNSVYVFGTEELGGTPVIAMELVGGGTLEDRVRTQGPMPSAQAVDAVLQIIAGLEAAQHIGILHRDIKPSNCFVDADGAVKIGDFGLSISTAVRTEPALTATSSFLGTPAFCSPEQVRGEELNARSDMYSSGATLFYLLTGRTPFQGKNVVALIASVLEQPAPSPRQFQPHLPRGLSNAVLRCLEKQPGERFKNYEELRRAIAPYSSAAPVPATLGLRFAAGLLDSLIVGVIGIMAMTVWSSHPFEFLRGATASQDTQSTFSPLSLFDLTSHSPWQILATTVCLTLYYALLEGRWGVTLGKLVFALRVVGPDNSPPGFLRALPRPLLYAVAPALPCWQAWADPKAFLNTSTTFQALVGFSYYVLVALLFSTARRRNGFAAVHDLITKTRVISRAALKARPAPTLAQTSPPAVEAKPLIGPYHILDTLEDSAGTAWLLGYDVRLLRKVWIRTGPADTPPIPTPLRNLGRVGRLRWLAGRRSAEENWDAFEAVSGQPLLRLLQWKADGTSNPQPWATVRFWLCDLATELSAAQKDGTLPPLLGLDRVWITGEGRAKLLDFPAPGFRAPPADVTSPPIPDTADTSCFLNQIAAAALEGRADAAVKPPSEVSVPLPSHVRKFFKGLPHAFDADALLLALRPLLQRVAVVTRSRRAAVVAACIVVPLFIAFSFLLGPALLDQWNRRNPGVFDLSQVLQQRKITQHWPKNQPAPTDRQFAIYIAEHFRATITNDASFSSPMANNFIKGENRRFAQESLAQRPAPTEDEIAAADAAVKKLLPGREMLDMMRKPSFAVMMLFVSLALYVGLPALIAALASRGGLILLATGVTFVRRDGTPASRGRMFWRALVAWSPLLLALVLWTAFMAVKNPGCAALALGGYFGLALLSVALPQRGLQDRLAGTWPVPR
jgi:hypothetical protein